MFTAAPERKEWRPSTVQDRQDVRVQMERIVASPPFCHSRRYPVLLRYVVEQTLNGHAETLKERTLGVTIFHRDATYDTNLDPVVRITAGEVRKRIAQYYHQAGHEDELRIDLPAGSYVPVFSLHAAGLTRATEAAAVLGAAEFKELAEEPPVATAVDSSPIAHPARLRPLRPPVRPPARWIFVAAAAVLTAFAAWILVEHRQSALNAAWAPILAPNTPVLISIGEPRLASTPQALETGVKPLPTIRDHVHEDYLVFSDVQALSRIMGRLNGERRDFRLQAASATSFADLRQGPAILIGGFDNPWTMRALHAQRFQLVRDLNGPLRIMDKQDPGNKRWAVDFSQTYADLTEDFAIVARFYDPDTRQPVMIVAGIGENGTKAAGELLSDPDSFRALFPGDAMFHSVRNFEAVIGAKVINGVSGPPKILAKQEW